jgi:hypothetical protein
MKKRMAKAFVIGVIFSLLALAGCDTPVNDDPDTMDNFKGKTWKSGPNAMNMWNVWEFKNDETFQFTHYHSADNPDPRGQYAYYVEDGVLYTTAPDGGKNNYSFTFADNLQSFTITSTPHTGGSAVYALVHPESTLADNVNFEAVDWTDSSVIIGYSAVAYTTADRATKETALGNLATDALAWHVRNRLPEEYRKDVDFAYTNGNGLQNEGEIPVGSITISSTRTNVMKGDTIYIFPITGAQLKTVLFSNRNNVTQVSKELNYTIDFTGEEVVVSNITVKGVAIQDDTTYWAASGRSPSGVGAEQGRITVPEEHGKYNTIIPYYVYALQTSQENPLTLSDSGRITVIRSGETGGDDGHEHMH